MPLPFQNASLIDAEWAYHELARKGHDSFSFQNSFEHLFGFPHSAADQSPLYAAYKAQMKTYANTPMQGVNFVRGLMMAQGYTLTELIAAEEDPNGDLMRREKELTQTMMLACYEDPTGRKLGEYMARSMKGWMGFNLENELNQVKKDTVMEDMSALDFSHTMQGRIMTSLLLDHARLANREAVQMYRVSYNVNTYGPMTGKLPDSIGYNQTLSGFQQELFGEDADAAEEEAVLQAMHNTDGASWMMGQNSVASVFHHYFASNRYAENVPSLSAPAGQENSFTDHRSVDQRFATPESIIRSSAILQDMADRMLKDHSDFSHTDLATVKAYTDQYGRSHYQAPADEAGLFAAMNDLGPVHDQLFPAGSLQSHIGDTEPSIWTLSAEERSNRITKLEGYLKDLSASGQDFTLEKMISTLTNFKMSVEEQMEANADAIEKTKEAQVWRAGRMAELQNKIDALKGMDRELPGLPPADFDGHIVLRPALREKLRHRGDMAGNLYDKLVDEGLFKPSEVDHNIHPDGFDSRNLLEMFTSLPGEEPETQSGYIEKQQRKLAAGSRQAQREALDAYFDKIDAFDIFSLDLSLLTGKDRTPEGPDGLTKSEADFYKLMDMMRNAQSIATEMDTHPWYFEERYPTPQAREAFSLKQNMLIQISDFTARGFIQHNQMGTDFQDLAEPYDEDMVLEFDRMNNGQLLTHILQHYRKEVAALRGVELSEPIRLTFPADEDLFVRLRENANALQKGEEPKWDIACFQSMFGYSQAMDTRMRDVLKTMGLDFMDTIRIDGQSVRDYCGEAYQNAKNPDRYLQGVIMNALTSGQSRVEVVNYNMGPDGQYHPQISAVHPNLHAMDRMEKETDYVGFRVFLDKIHLLPIRTTADEIDKMWKKDPHKEDRHARILASLQTLSAQKLEERRRSEEAARNVQPAKVKVNAEALKKREEARVEDGKVEGVRPQVVKSEAVKSEAPKNGSMKSSKKEEADKEPEVLKNKEDTLVKKSGGLKK